MRGPGVAVGVLGVGGVHDEGLGEEQQVGGLGQSVGDGDVAADVEQRLIREVQEGCEAGGFRSEGAGESASVMVLLLGSRSRHNRFQANGGRLYAGWKTGNLGTGTPEGVPRTAVITQDHTIQAIVMRALLRLEFGGFPSPIAEWSATSGDYPVEEKGNKAAKCPNRRFGVCLQGLRASSDKARA
jgi:hypothetical protein